MSHVLQVGKPYNPKVRRWPETIEYNYRGGEHELLLLFGAPGAAEREGVASGAIELALLVHGPVIAMLIQVGQDGDALPWSDALFHVSNLPPGDYRPPPAESQAAFRVVLIDADTGIIEAMRYFLLPEQFTAALHAAIREQAAHPLTRPEFETAAAVVYGLGGPNPRESSAKLATLASHKATVRAKAEPAAKA